MAHYYFLWQDLSTGVKNIFPCDFGHIQDWPLPGGICVSQTHLVYTVDIKSTDISINCNKKTQPLYNCTVYGTLKN